MFSKLAIIVAASMAVLVAAAPAPGGGINNSCNTGPVQCCNSVTKTNKEEATFLKQLIGIEVPVDAVIGKQCSPLSVLGVGNGSSCQSQPVCCSNNSFKGLVAIGCSPVNVNI